MPDPRTKIIATLGPASESEAVLEAMIQAGLDMARLNFSHGTHGQHRKRAAKIRQLNRRLSCRVSIMQDLEGYRIRIRGIKKELKVKPGQKFYLFSSESSQAGPMLDCPGSCLSRIKAGMDIFIDDGKIKLSVVKSSSKKLLVRIDQGGAILNNKGVNIPQATLAFPPVNEKDLKDLKAFADEKPEFVAQSFVRDAADIKALKKIVLALNPSCKIFSKIENLSALKNIDEIILESDGIVVARGDLGICLPIYKVPVFQKIIIHKCLKYRKPVVVATQMLDSMTSQIIPTRAEVTDVANAIIDGATHLMLSQETAIGAYPGKVVDMMNKVIMTTEKYLSNRDFF